MSLSISDVVSIPAPPLIAGESFTATWTLDAEQEMTTGDINVYTITLEPCASSTQSSCTCESEGNALAVSLCESCSDSDQSYDVEVPRDSAPGVYVVRVSLSEDPTSVFACSEGFTVQEEEVKEAGAPGIEAGDTSSGAYLRALEGQSASPGEAFTAKWYYDAGSDPEEEEEEGAGGSAGDFAVDLYSCADGGCAGGRYTHGNQSIR